MLVSNDPRSISRTNIVKIWKYLNITSVLKLTRLNNISCNWNTRFNSKISCPLGALVSDVDFEPKDHGFSNPTQLKKDENKIFKVLPGEKKTESTFSRIQFGINIRNFGSWILRVIFRDRNFRFDKNFRNSNRSFSWAETGEFYEVSGENELLCKRYTQNNFSGFETHFLS
jgi:hypothetical protein